jgi:hypothetical protein
MCWGLLDIAEPSRTLSRKWGRTERAIERFGPGRAAPAQFIRTQIDWPISLTEGISEGIFCFSLPFLSHTAIGHRGKAAA